MSQLASRLDQVRGHIARGEHAPAVALALRLAQAHPADAGVAALASRAHLLAGDLTRAAHYASRAAQLSPGDPALLVELAGIESLAGRRDKADQAYQRALTLAPDHIGARHAWAAALCERQALTDALRLVDEGLARTRGEPALAMLRAGCLLNLARAREAARVLQDLAAARPDDPALLSGLCVLSNYDDTMPVEAVAACHQRYGELVTRLDPPPGVVLTNTPDPKRPLRVGLVSPDLRRHSVAAFVEPILRHAPEAEWRLTVYQTNRIADDVTRRLRRLVEQRPGAGPDAWRVMDTAADDALAQRIYDDRIDVLFELSGHTHGHSLGAVRLGPAPIVVSAIGYPNTTGLRLGGWRLVDSITDPPGAERWSTETLLRCDPCFLCYQPPEALPDLAGPAAARPFTFGSFNAAQKINPTTIELWSRVLLACPGSRLVLKAMNFRDEALRADIAGRFAHAGVDAARVEVRPPQDAQAGHLAAYADIDAALDPTPYAGTTTTCEALVMGVPVVTLAGDRHAARVGASLLHACGESARVAQTAQDYIAIASALAAQGPREGDARRTLRAQFLASRVCDGRAYATALTRAVRAAWSGWCAGKGAGRC